MIASARGTLATKKEYPPETEVKPEEEARIGVFVCHCGINIGGVVNVPAVKEYAAHARRTWSMRTKISTPARRIPRKRSRRPSRSTA